ncbi:uncharacterized protein LOC8057034 isoform X1 [Sorghum bicolor]|uniref:uncharacterized protein LOC8057034 isoform X1 n=1 Tax=Sorghum bicolor TaxID=4558 RepID=UPI000B4267B9|nr:uncharacterized protein LOC8057034 isoform X1 [Sorghum bicolor]|eukprot:XP_021316369.1 uncharacterized protein LOC8057034 isoform X1 [Sorghum bicolor]
MGLLLEIALLGIPLHPPVSSLFPSSPQEECSRLEIAPPSPGPNFPWCRISLLRAVVNPVGFVRLFHSSPPPVFLRGLVCPRRLSLFLSSSLACCCCSSSSSRPTDPGGKGADDGGLGGAASVQLLPLPEPRLPPRRHYFQGLSGKAFTPSLISTAVIAVRC